MPNILMFFRRTLMSSPVADMSLPLAVGMLLRLVWGSWVPVVPVSDSAMYWVFAQSIAAGNGYAYPDGGLTAYWPVGTSAIHGFLIWLAGPGFWHVVALNLIVGFMTMGLTYALAKLCGMTRRQATMATWIMALWPLQIQFVTIVASEMLFNGLMLLALVLWLKCTDRIQKSTLLAVIAMVGAVYVRPTAMPLLIAMPLVALFFHTNLRLFVQQVLIVAVVAAALFGPWMARNMGLMGHPVVVSTNFGPNFWMGNNPQTNGGYMPLTSLEFENEHQRDLYYKKLAMDYIKAEPLEFVRNIGRRFMLTYDRESIGVHWNQDGIRASMGEAAMLPLKIWSLVYWWAIFMAGVAGLFGLACRWKSSPGVTLSLVCASLFFLVPLVTVGQDRYHAPLLPFLALGAASLFGSPRVPGIGWLSNAFNRR